MAQKLQSREDGLKPDKRKENKCRTRSCAKFVLCLGYQSTGHFFVKQPRKTESPIVEGGYKEAEGERKEDKG